MPWAFLLFPCGRFPLGNGEGLPAGWSCPLRCGRFGKGGGGMEAITSRQNKVVREAAELCPLRGSAGNGGSSSARAPAFVRTRPALGWRFCGALSRRRPGKKYAHYLRPVLAASGESYRIADHVAGLLSSTKHPQGGVLPMPLAPQPARTPGPAGNLLRSAGGPAGPRQPGHYPPHGRGAGGFTGVPFGGVLRPPLPQGPAGFYGGRCSA